MLWPPPPFVERTTQNFHLFWCWPFLHKSEYTNLRLEFIELLLERLRVNIFFRRRLHKLHAKISGHAVSVSQQMNIQYYWNCNSMNYLVGWLVGLSVCRSVCLDWLLHFQWPYWNTCSITPCHCKKVACTHKYIWTYIFILNPTRHKNKILEYPTNLFSHLNKIIILE